MIHFLFHSLLNVRLLFLWMNEVNHPVGRTLFIPSSYVNNLRLHQTVSRILYSIHFETKIFLIYLNDLLLALLPRLFTMRGWLAGPFLDNMMILSHHLSFFFLFLFFFLRYCLSQSMKLSLLLFLSRQRERKNLNVWRVGCFVEIEEERHFRFFFLSLFVEGNDERSCERRVKKMSDT